MRILVANFFPAFFPPSSGGEQRYFHLYKHLSRWHDVTLFSATFTDRTEELVEHSASFREYRVPKAPVSDRLHWDLYHAGIGDECSALVVGMAGAVDSPIRRRFAEALRRADVVIHESPFTFPLDETAYLDGKPRVYASYNVEHRLAAQMLGGASGGAATDFIRFLEGLLVARAEMVFATSREDAEAFAADFGCDASRIRLAPNGFEPEAHGEAPPTLASPDSSARPYAIFLGSGHPPNVEAARFVRDVLAPAVPEVEFRILGSVCKRIETDRSMPPNLRLLGFVEEAQMRAQLGACAAALNPLFSGSGTNLKMLQYMACGAPILTTPIGARGIELEPGREALVCESDGFAEALRRLAADPAYARTIGERARAKAYQRYSWRQIAERYAHDLDELSSRIAPRSRRLLLHVNDYPVDTPAGGGQVRIHQLLRQLAEDFDVELLCLTDRDEPYDAEFAGGPLQRAFPKTPEHREAERVADRGRDASVRDIVAADWISANGPFTRAFRAALPDAAAVVFEHCYLAPLVALVPAHVPVIYASQNVEADLKEGTLAHRPDAARWIERAAELEARLVERANLVVAVSREDACRFSERYGKEAVIVVENGVEEHRPLQVEGEGRASDRPRAIFIGSAHPPNIVAAEFILERLAPSLPGIDFHIVGSVGEAVARIPRGPNVTCHGPVDERRKALLFSSSTIAINPMALGGGSSLKVPDVLAAGLPLVSTSVGARGFGLQPGIDYEEAALSGFASAVERLSRDEGARRQLSRVGRRAVRRLSWPVLGSRLRREVRALLRPARHEEPRLLVVTYRLAQPAPGGAEAYLNHLLSGLASHGGLTIDVAACDVGILRNHWHFSAIYEAAEPSQKAPDGVRNVLRFPVDPASIDVMGACRQLFSAWMGESCRQWRDLFEQVRGPILLGGWNFAESSGGRAWRWSSVSSQIGFEAGDRAFRLAGSSPAPRKLTLRSRGGILAEADVNGRFSLEVPLEAGRQIVELAVDCAHIAAEDPRELGVAVHEVSVLREAGWEALDLATDGEAVLRGGNVEAWIESLIEATESRRDALDALFASVRGPHSFAMAEWLERHAGEYDAMLVQGTPFAPIVWAPPIARARGIPVVLLPHYHVEDRYYHWKSYYKAFRDSECVLAFPRGIKGFFDEIGARAEVVAGGGIDLAEFEPTRLDATRAAFRRVHSSPRPFVLVLGRKAGGKGYASVLDAVSLADRGPAGFDVVLIGPDDDGLPIEQRGVIYYGPRPRDFVLGALAECLCLVNMSTSESFGIVLLEAWAAGRPVVAQRRCLAFSELVEPGVNGFLAESADEVRDRVDAYLGDPAMASRHGAAGRSIAQAHAWSAVAEHVHRTFIDQTRPAAGGAGPAAALVASSES